MPVKMQMTLEKRVEKIIDEAIELADLGGKHSPARKTAERVFDSEPDLISELSRTWIVDRLAWMISRRRRERWNSSQPDQMLLDDPVFHGLPKRIFMGDGKRPKLDRCTLTQTVAHLRLLQRRSKNDARVVQFEALVTIHRKWAKEEQGISWGDAMRRESAERER